MWVFQEEKNKKDTNMWICSHACSLIRRFRTHHSIAVHLRENDIVSASICTDNEMQTRTCANKPCLSAHLKYRFPATDPAGLSHKRRWNTQIVDSFLWIIELGTGIRTNRDVIMTKSVRTSMMMRVETSWTETLKRGATQYYVVTTLASDGLAITHACACMCME